MRDWVATGRKVFYTEAVEGVARSAEKKGEEGFATESGRNGRQKPRRTRRRGRRNCTKKEKFKKKEQRFRLSLFLMN
jgi:hypothetical protein